MMTFAEAKLLLDRLDELDANYTVSLTNGQKISSIFVSGVQYDSENYHPILSALTTAFGKINKEISSGLQSWKAEKDNTHLTMYRVAQCKITGYRSEERKVTKEVETEETETVEIPIYDCSGAE